MFRILLICALLAPTVAIAQKNTVIIFDTDIAPDYDDVGALALLHAFADNGEATLLATISCNTFETTAPVLSVLNTYFRRPSIPIGITKGSFPDKDCRQEWAQYILGRYPHSLKNNSVAEEAVHLYRRLLAAQPDTSVTIVSVGFFTNLANLLESSADAVSPLKGLDLVSRKVKRLVSMAARLGDDGKGGFEFNVMVDAKASQKVFSSWPTPIILSGFETGEKILTGIRLIQNEAIARSPVKDAFRVALEQDKNTKGRNSWDQTAVYVAVRGISPLFGSRKVSLQILDDGKSVPVPGEKFTWLTFAKTPDEIATVIEALMMHQPRAD